MLVDWLLTPLSGSALHHVEPWVAWHARAMALAWGVVPLRSPFVPNTDEMIVQGEALVKRQGLAQPGDLIIMLGGQSHTAGATNMLRVHIIA